MTPKEFREYICACKSMNYTLYTAALDAKKDFDAEHNYGSYETAADILSNFDELLKDYELVKKAK